MLFIGDLVVDCTARVTDGDLARWGLAKGRRKTVDPTFINDLLAQIEDRSFCGGGSTGNTAFAYAGLGGQGTYLTARAADDYAELSLRELESVGLDVLVNGAPVPGSYSNICLCLVTPDGERTMLMGAETCFCSIPFVIETLQTQDHPSIFMTAYSAIGFGIEGFRQIAETALNAGKNVYLSLSNPVLAANHRDAWIDLMRAGASVFSNQGEFSPLLDGKPAHTLQDFLSGDAFAAMTDGEHGAHIVTTNDVMQTAAVRVTHVQNTTGAGDHYAAGFLYGLSQGMGLAECAQFAAQLAARKVAAPASRLEKEVLAGFIGSVAA
jgi:sugar/nucleoside kinase (ribokinase family)